MYRSMQDHWLRMGPPAYISAAVEMGHKPPREDDDSELVQDPAQLAAALSAFPGGRVV